MTRSHHSLQQLDSTDFYIANQLTAEGLDELQRMLLLYRHGLHTALDGPPGVGKTRAIIEVAQILNVPLFTKNCSSRTTESHIISYPSLTVKDGASVTIQISGPLIRALHTPGIFYGDEFNLLKEDVQKRLNSAFDERRAIDRSDGRLIRAKPGFWGVISYNPTQNLAIQDLEDSVADRFVHLQFERWNSDFKAYISACKASNNGRSPEARRHDFGIDLEERGIDPQTLQFYRRVSDQDGSMAWQDFFTGKSISTKPAYTYLSRRTKPLFR
ncbi:MAG: MoxR family ATPase, partial [Leptospiraceae bacterium]|nr:MoxR family ATPase [Leptospiraceae bacterium]